MTRTELEDTYLELVEEAARYGFDPSAPDPADLDDDTLDAVVQSLAQQVETVREVARRVTPVMLLEFAENYTTLSGQAIALGYPASRLPSGFDEAVAMDPKVLVERYGLLAAWVRRKGGAVAWKTYLP